MNTAAVGKGITPYDSLVRLDGHVHQAADHTARGINLGGVDVRLDAQVGMRLEDHGHLLERGIASALAYAVDGHLHLTGSGQHTCYGIGCGHAQVVVAMRGQDGLAGSEGIDVLIEILYLLVILVGHAEARRIGNVADSSASLADSFDDAGQVLIVRTASILGIELNILDVLLGILDGSHSTLDDFLRR